MAIAMRVEMTQHVEKRLLELEEMLAQAESEIITGTRESTMEFVMQARSSANYLIGYIN